jgi:hypothetical protein
LSETPEKDEGKALTMPSNVRAIQVISLMDDICELGSGTHVSKLAEKIGADISVLLPILNASEMLGLVRSENGSIYLTDDGLKFEGTSLSNILTLLRKKIALIEPFRTAIELASRSGSTTAKEAADRLAARGIQWDYRPELNESLVNTLLIHWAIRAALLSYDGKTGKFQTASAETGTE